MRTRQMGILGSIALAATGSAIAQSEGMKDSRPNFIVILVDDMGFSDLGCFGGELSTPNIDRLAENGLRLTQMYNCARSCPTRASILTGLYPQQAGVGFMTGKLNDAYNSYPEYQGKLNEKCVTFGEVLQSAGYFTAMTGKWHVGGGANIDPSRRGFDRTLHGSAGGFYFPSENKMQLTLNGEKIKHDDPRLPDNWYSTDLWTDYGLRFIDEAIGENKPFVLYLAHNAPHFPVQAPQEDIERWRGKFMKGWDKLREERYQRQMEMDLFGKKYPLTPMNPLVPEWDSLSEEQKEQSDLIMAIYAACIERIDKSVGHLVQSLKQKGVFDNTYIIFLSDNGGNPEGSLFGRCTGKNPGDVKSSVFIGHAWAGLTTTPFFMYKHHTHEGGTASPTIISFPKAIDKKKNGTVVNTPMHIIDVMATMVDYGKAKYPKQYKNRDVTPMQGVSMRPVFEGGKLDRKDPIFFEHENNWAMREGDWKIVRENSEEWQLYNIKNDRTEMNNLAASNPLKLNEMLRKFDKMVEKTGAKELPFETKSWFVKVKDYTKKMNINNNNK